MKRISVLIAVAGLFAVMSAAAPHLAAPNSGIPHWFKDVPNAPWVAFGVEYQD